MMIFKTDGSNRISLNFIPWQLLTFLIFIVILLTKSFLNAEIPEEQPTNVYKLKTGDRLEASIYMEGNSKRNLIVDYSGKVSYLNAKGIQAKGKSIIELRNAIQKELSHYYRDPILLMMPIGFGSEYYTILGEVRLPGLKPFVGSPTILTALSEGGGFTTRVFRNQTIDQADFNLSFLARKGEYIPVDFDRLLNQADISQDVPLFPGDYIYIAAKTIPRVYVLGEVGIPSSVSFFDSISLSEAIAEAGGITNYASSRVGVIRGSLCCPIRYLIDFNRIIKGCALDFPLEAGDIVYVPAMQYCTLKEIVRAGITAFVSQAFSIAGTSAFVAITPHAAVTGVIAPVPFVNTTAGIITPVTVTPAP